MEQTEDKTTEDKTTATEDKKQTEKQTEDKATEDQKLENLKKVIEERNKMKDDITTCEWCGMAYPKGGWTYYKILVRNMNLEKLAEKIEKGIKDDVKNSKMLSLDKHVICSDCYEHLKECTEC